MAFKGTEGGKINSDQILEHLFDTIDLIAGDVVKNSPADITIEARIIKLKNANIGEYLAVYKGSTYTVYSLDVTHLYPNGSSVYVLVKEGNFSNKKIILGYAADGNVTYAELQELTAIPVQQGPNWVDPEAQWYWRDRNYPEPLQIISGIQADPGWSGMTVAPPLLPSPANPGQTGDKQFLDIGWTYSGDAGDLVADTRLQQFSAQFDKVLIRASFLTDFAMLHSKGSYSLVVECYEEMQHTDTLGNTETTRQIRVMELGFPTFIGNPYSYATNYVENQAVYRVARGALKGLRRVYLKQDGNMEPDATLIVDSTTNTPLLDDNFTDPNIFCKDILICFCTEENLTEDRYRLLILADKGQWVSNAMPEITLRGQLLFGKRDILEESSYDCLWFREDAEVIFGHEQFREEAGAGWRQIRNDFTFCPGGPDPGNNPTAANQNGLPLNADGGNDWSLWNTNKSQKYKEEYNIIHIPYKFNGDEVVPWQWRYKLVVISKEDRTVIFSETKTVFNQESIYDLSLDKFVGGKNWCFILDPKSYSEEGQHTYLRPVNNKDAAQSLDGVWHLGLPNGEYSLISSAAEHHWDAFEITDWLYNHIATFTVNVYEFPVSQTPTYSPVTGQDPINGVDFKSPRLDGKWIGVLSHEITDALGEADLWIEWVGTKLYNYNADGEIQNFYSSTEDRQLYPKLHWAPGKGGYHTIEILAPGPRDADGNPTWVVLREKSTYHEEDGWTVENSMMHNMWLGNFIITGQNPDVNNNVIHYHIKQKYDNEATDNTYGIRVRTVTGALILEDWCEISFSKTGNPGTNGTGFEFHLGPVKPQSALDDDYDIDLINPQPLWYNNAWINSVNASLWLRPFATKDGKLVETLNQGYTFDVFYDVRYGQYTANEVVGWIDGNTGAQITPAAASKYQPLTLSVPFPGPNVQTDGATAIIKGITNNYTTGKGVIRVAGRTPPNHWYNFNAYVRAQCNIFRNGTLVQTLYDIYPIDFHTGTKEIQKNKISTNWPRKVTYNTTGYNPEEYDRILYFRYADHPTDEQKINQNLGATNMTPTIQDLQPEVYGAADSGVEQRYRAKGYYVWANGHTGVIRTANTIPVVGGNYYRNIIFHLNAFGNVDINGWDGTGIDIDEDAGTLFAPTIGAGYKNPFTNKFSGVIMGIDKSQRKSFYNSTNDSRFGNGTFPYNDSEFKNNQIFSVSDAAKMDYMTGVYGYQEGVSSFGLMENGTLFLGRADRGGRIIVDGFNASLYGGLYGMLDHSPTIGDPMWNQMRINLVDLPAISNGSVGSGTTAAEFASPKTVMDPSMNASGTTNAGSVLGFNGEYFRDTINNMGTYTANGETSQASLTVFPWWYRKIWQEAHQWPNGPTIDRLYQSSTDNFQNNQFNFWDDPPSNNTHTMQDGSLKYTTTFGPRRASTTPAIEIGQHPRWLFPGQLRIKDLPGILGSMFIPGDRNFLVQYDGSLWAMNATIMGNIIGSNLVGGALLGGYIDIGIDDSATNSTYDYFILSPSGVESWPMVQPPTQINGFWSSDPNADDQNLQPGPGHESAFHVNPDGEVWMKSAHIRGGSFHIKDFHLAPPTDPIHGHRPANTFGTDQSTDCSLLVMFGESNFVGPTKFYGNVGVGGVMGGNTPQNPDRPQGFGAAAKRMPSVYTGNFKQVNGYSAMGIWASLNTYDLQDIEEDPYDYAPLFSDARTSGKTSTYIWPWLFYAECRPSESGSPNMVFIGGGKSTWIATMDDFTHSGESNTYVTTENGTVKPPVSNLYRVDSTGLHVTNYFMYYPDDWCGTVFERDALNDNLSAYLFGALKTNSGNYAMGFRGHDGKGEAKGSFVIESEWNTRFSSRKGIYMYSNDKYGRNVNTRQSWIILSSDIMDPDLYAQMGSRGTVFLHQQKQGDTTHRRGLVIGHQDNGYNSEVLDEATIDGQQTSLYNADDRLHLYSGPFHRGDDPNHSASSEVLLGQGGFRAYGREHWDITVGPDWNLHNPHPPEHNFIEGNADGTFRWTALQFISIHLGERSEPVPDTPGVLFRWSEAFFSAGSSTSIHGDRSEIRFEGSWATPENQHNIYARFA